MSFAVPNELAERIDVVVGRYPEPRSAALMVLHALQEHFGWLSQEAMQWTAQRLSIQPIHVLELITFYPMFRQAPAGKFQLKVCRSLSCALGGAAELRRHLCERLGLDAEVEGLQVTTDGRFSIEWVECLASCGTAPVLVCGDEVHEGVSVEMADKVMAACAEPGAKESGQTAAGKTVKRRGGRPAPRKKRAVRTRKKDE